jgi:hypothetical protein
MASGKTFLICALGANWLRTTPDLKVIIAVPQLIIAPGFRQNKLLLPDGTRATWEIEVDLTHESAKNSTAHLLQFMKRGTSRTLLCTHATLARVFQKEPEAFKNVLVAIDEAHHVSEQQNQLGQFVKYALANPDDIRLGLATATFFRGDASAIISDQTAFDRFDLPYDEFLATCKHLRSFAYDFIIEPNFTTGLERLFKERIGKTIVYIPPVGNRYSLGSKHADRDAALCAIAGTDKPVIKDADQPVMRVQRGKQWVRVVDLVSEHLRAEKRQAIEDAHQGNGDDIDVLIALGIFKEGGNWRYADREIIIGHRHSLTEVTQTIGRLFRDVEGKQHVQVFQLLPATFATANTEQTREDLNDFLKAVMLSMLLENVLDPAIPDVEDADEGEPAARPRINYLI